jgi:hypothetical protein
MLMDAFQIFNGDRTKRFLDVGCGMGSKVILASPVFDSYGLEYNEKYVQKAHALGLARVMHCDAFEFKDYKTFDLIYYYRPIFTPDLYYEFETIIHKNLKIGALVAPMHSAYNWDGMKDMEKMGKYLYRKKS